VFAAAVAAPARAQDLYQQAVAAARREQLDSAYDLIQRAAEAEPDRAEVQVVLGQLACAKVATAGVLNRFLLARKCKAALGRAAELAPDSIGYVAAFAQYLASAPGIVGGDRDSALKLAEVIRPRDEVAATFVIATAYLSMGDLRMKARADSAVEDLERRRAGDRLAILRVAGYWAATNQPERALASYEHMVERDPKDPVAQFFLGRQFVLMKREPRRAQEHLRLAAAAPPSDSAVSFTPGAPWYRLGQTYVQLAMPDSARLCYEEALRINPRLNVARVALDSLEGR
jgi:tetratricopeptide (TPR) repeat protein